MTQSELSEVEGLDYIEITVSGKTETRLVVTRPENGIVASCAYREGIHTLSIRQLFVYSTFRRKGIGSDIMRVCIRQAKDIAAESVSLMLSPCDHEAFPFYRKFGFVVVGEFEDGELILALPLKGDA